VPVEFEQAAPRQVLQKAFNDLRKNMDIKITTAPENNGHNQVTDLKIMGCACRFSDLAMTVDTIPAKTGGASFLSGKAHRLTALMQRLVRRYIAGVGTSLQAVFESTRF